MDKFLVVANWKANAPVAYDFPVPDDLEIAIAAPFPLITSISKPFTKAAQDVSAYPFGPYTGEVPARLLSELEVKYCLVGHSERRKWPGETNRQVEAKMDQAIKAGILPIICAQNLAEIPENIRNFEERKFLIMYEPSSAISAQGQYHAQTPENVMTTLTDWRNKLNLHCRFLYGGSINPDNVGSFLTPEIRPIISGFVVGHASLNASSFSAIIKKCLVD